MENKIPTAELVCFILISALAGYQWYADWQPVVIGEIIFGILVINYRLTRPDNYN